MLNNRLVAGAVAAVVGIVVGLLGIFAAAWIATTSSPATDANRVNPNEGFVPGSVDYGSRGDDGETN
ncbi:hypothetical protein GOARA_013_00580 [Gordonia araii NBRC 100433]|uniref:DUF2613 domain-containing protein n=1 Tax=Gordonia araii NBRC 100433 TaxID=1073574 RepID=G7GYD9_9ACTN|nr:DUF2613 family protein [Gordonia araii]NNG97388.1 DUF2613 family protein [Gordonia araii NBRC 100433]GAB08614.1 hypothetical protein GOARA_013_00580 [Gordonia araii NBRC 100433]